MTQPPVTVIIEYRAIPERAEQAGAELNALVATVVATEPDCFGIEFLCDAEDPARMLLVERWSSQNAYFGAHFQTPHIRAFIAKATDWFAGPPNIQVWATHANHVRG
ncbi:MAG: putative quinol monooxygenase [Vicinamibacterales bacterium]|nr:putative quinol monooxygenase [Vicinamibacterales bacterium]